jgi:hypothetical protein
MTLPASGAISFNNINVELGVSGTTQASLGQASYRTLAGVASGAISMSNFYGKANQFAFTISSNQTNANLRTLAVNAGWNQSSKVVATIGSGIYVSSNGTGTPGLTVNGSFPGGVELTNNGFIIGMGGNGSNGGSASVGNPVPGGSGGTALFVSVGVSIRNNGTIGGGGGGGGGGGFYYFDTGYGVQSSGGGGGGGGRTGATNSSGGSGGTFGYAGAAGGAGTASSAGSGGVGGNGGQGGTGGSGGSWGSGGGTGTASNNPGAAGGGGGGAVSGNSNITWLATGTRLGAIS